MTARIRMLLHDRGWRSRPASAWPLAALALLTLIGPLWANIQVWPVEYLGYAIDLRSGQVTDVLRGSVAAEAGLRVGDHLLSIYGVPWAEAVFGWSQWHLVERNPSYVAVTVARSGEVLAFELPRRAPEPSHQIAKVVFALLGAACWMTGALLGLGRRHEVNGSRLVAAYWLSLGGILGCYVFAVDLCLPLFALLTWFMTTILPPATVGLHVWFPARPMSQWRNMIARQLLLGAWVASNLLVAIGWLVWRPTLAELLAYGWLPLVAALTAAFFGSVVLLGEAYRRVRIPHVRRQIRLIFAACLITVCVWLVFRLVPLALALPPLLPDAVIDLTPILIPLAYLVSGGASSLYTLDRLARRAAGTLFRVTVVAIVFSVAVALVADERRGLVIWLGLVLGVLSRPFLRVMHRLGGHQRNPDRLYTALRQARHQLTTSLDPAVLLAAIRDGLHDAFNRPPMAIYKATPGNTREITLVERHRFPDLPPSLPMGTLTEQLLGGALVVEAHELHLALRAAKLTAAEEVAVRHQGVALWGVVRQRPDDLLALILIGTDTSLEPYRAEDRREIGELLAAAGLALAHSSAYERVCRTENQLRELFDTMRRIEDETAADLAREVHDEIINIYVQLNITSLQQLLDRVSDPAIRSVLTLVLESEQGLNKALRVVCERPHPTGLNDPMGLPGVLRELSTRVLAAWPGTCELAIEGEGVPIDPDVQLEIYRITREALANVVKHAEATTIRVHLRYPDQPDQLIRLAIIDNGRSGKAVQPRSEHRGVHNMQESARAAGAHLAFERALGGGASVVVCFHPSGKGRTERPGHRLAGQTLRSI